MKMPRPLARLARAQNGNVAVIFAVAAPLVVGSAALGVETSYWYYRHHQLQGAADNAAYAASLENRNGSSASVVDAAALKVASQNGFDQNTGGTITVQLPPATGAYAGNPNAVKVMLTQPSQRFFTQLFSNAPVIIKTDATAMYQTATNACILALDPSAAQAAYFSGSSSLTLAGCVVMSDSTASSGVYVWGASSLTASCVVSAGGVQQKGTINETGCAAPMTNVQPAPDPYRNLAAPATDGPCLTVPNNGNPIVLQPGHYCSGLNFGNGDYTLEPGTYVVDGGIKSNGNGSVTGDGVTIYLTDNSGVNFNGNTTLKLTAPSSGTYDGILFYGNRQASAATNQFNGTATSVMTGALYFPSQNVTYIGNFAGANGCTQIVADTVTFSGSTSFGVNCATTPGAAANITVMSAVKLVG